MYILKLHHLVDDKIHARSTGPYSLVTQQPRRQGPVRRPAFRRDGSVGARGLRRGEHPAGDIDREIGRRGRTCQNVRSDRQPGENIPEPGVPESGVLIKELQSLGLDIKVLSEDRAKIIHPGTTMTAPAIGHQHRGAEDLRRRRGAEFDAGDDGDRGYRRYLSRMTISTSRISACLRMKTSTMSFDDDVTAIWKKTSISESNIDTEGMDDPDDVLTTAVCSG